MGAWITPPRTRRIGRRSTMNNEQSRIAQTRNIDQEFEFYEFFSFLKFNEFYEFFFG